MKKIIFGLLFLGFFIYIDCIYGDEPSSVLGEDSFMRSPQIINNTGVCFSVEIPASAVLHITGRDSLQIENNGITYMLRATCQTSDRLLNNDSFALYGLLGYDVNSLLKNLLEEKIPDSDDTQTLDVTVGNFHGKKMVGKVDIGMIEYLLLINGNYFVNVSFVCPEEQLEKADQVAQQMIQSMIIEFPQVQLIDDKKEITFLFNGEKYQFYLPSWMEFYFEAPRRIYLGSEELFAGPEKTISVTFITDSEGINFVKNIYMNYESIAEEKIGSWAITNFSDSEDNLKKYASLAQKGNFAILVSANAGKYDNEPFAEAEKAFLKNFWKETALLENK